MYFMAELHIISVIWYMYLFTFVAAMKVTCNNATGSGHEVCSQLNAVFSILKYVELNYSLYIY